MKHADLILYPLQLLSHLQTWSKESESWSSFPELSQSFPRALSLFTLTRCQHVKPPEPILPPSIIVSPIWLSLDSQITDTTRSMPAPPEGSEGKVFVPSTLRLPLIVYTAAGSGHPHQSWLHYRLPPSGAHTHILITVSLQVNPSEVCCQLWIQPKHFSSMCSAIIAFRRTLYQTEDPKFISQVWRGFFLYCQGVNNTLSTRPHCSPTRSCSPDI